MWVGGLEAGAECKCLLSWLWYAEDFIRFINLYEDFLQGLNGTPNFFNAASHSFPIPICQDAGTPEESCLAYYLLGHLAVRSRQFRGIKIRNQRRTLEEPLTHWLFLLDWMVLTEFPTLCLIGYQNK